VLVVDYGYDHGRPVSDAGADRVIGNLLEIVAMNEPSPSRE
jgi:hypothetical protein